MSNFFKDKRIARGYSQQHVADVLGYLSKQQVSNFERSISLPSLEVLPKLAELYEVDLNDLIKFVENEKIKRIKNESANFRNEMVSNQRNIESK